MPLSEAVLRLTATPGFWADYLFEKGRPGAAYPELKEVPVEFPVCPGYRLTLRLGAYLHPHLDLVPPLPTSPPRSGATPTSGATRAPTPCAGRNWT
jgi:hypothetical protein